MPRPLTEISMEILDMCLWLTLWNFTVFRPGFMNRGLFWVTPFSFSFSTMSAHHLETLLTWSQVKKATPKCHFKTTKPD